MNHIKAFIFMSLFGSATAMGGVGLNVGVGVPFLSQAGINYQFNPTFGMSANYGLFEMTSGISKVKLAMPELLVNYHPFEGSFFLGAGLGQETMEAVATSNGQTASITVDAMTTVVKTGWMWGIGNGGFWFGMDISYIAPTGAKETIVAPGVATTDQVYLDAHDAAEKFGKLSYTNITFARIGWLF